MKFKLSLNDIQKIEKSLSYIEEKSLFLQKGSKQNFIRKLMDETDENGNLKVIVYGSEVVLDNDIPEDIYLYDKSDFIKTVKRMTDCTLYIENDKIVIDSSGFKKSLVLSEFENHFVSEGSKKDVIERIKGYIKNGFDESTFAEKLSFTMTKQDFDDLKFGKMHNLLTFNVSNNILTIEQEHDGDTFSLECCVLETDQRLTFNVDGDIFFKLPSDQYNGEILLTDGVVSSMILKSNQDKFIIPINDED